MGLKLLEDIVISEGGGFTILNAGLVLKEAANEDLGTELYQILGKALRKFDNKHVNAYINRLLREVIWPRLFSNNKQDYYALGKFLTDKKKQYEGVGNNNPEVVKKFAYELLADVAVTEYKDKVDEYFAGKEQAQPQQTQPQQAEEDQTEQKEDQTEQKEDHACIVYTDRGQQLIVKGSGIAARIIHQEISNRLPSRGMPIDDSSGETNGYYWFIRSLGGFDRGPGGAVKYIGCCSSDPSFDKLWSILSSADGMDYPPMMYKRHFDAGVSSMAVAQ